MNDTDRAVLTLAAIFLPVCAISRGNERMQDRHSIKTISFVLTPGYALMSLASAVEPLRAANHLAAKELYRCAFHSLTGGFIASTSGGGFVTDPVASLLGKRGETPDLVFVVAGGNPMTYHDARLAASMRRLHQKNVALGGISGGSAILAKDGLMAKRRFTVHWAHVDSLLEYGPELLVERSLYVIDRDRYTCAGGVAALDMMCAMIAREHGSDLARGVSEWFIHSRLRGADEPQRSAAHRFNLRHPRLEAAVELMESHLADPVSPNQLAALSGCSIRQLQRLFSVHLGMPMMTFYRDLRLAKADELLQQSTASVLDIGLLTGFASPAHFTRCFTEKYKHSPVRRRKLSSWGW